MTTSALSSEFTFEQPKKIHYKNPGLWIFSHSSHYWYLILVAVIGAMANALGASVIPVMIGQAFNLISSPEKDLSGLLEISLIIIGSQILRSALQFARNFGAELLGQKMERDIRHDLYTSLLGKSMTFHSLQPVGDTMARATNDVREINLMFNPGFNLVVGSAFFIIVPLIIAPSYHPSLILVPAFFVIGYVLALWFYLRELQPITSSVRKAFGRLNTRLAEAIDGIETVKGMAQEQSEVVLFENNARRYRDAFVNQGDIEARYIPLLLLGVAQGLALFQALLLYANGTIDLGSVVGYIGLIQLFNFPTFISLFAYSQVSLGMASSERILNLINEKTELDQNESGHSAKLRGEIEFRNVCFSYDGTTQVLKGLSFKVEPGQRVAIVGQTGSGKSTISKLVNRTYDATSGQVLVDGIDVRDWNLESLRKQISIIEQDIFLFSRPIAENIKFGKNDATEDELKAAAVSAQAHDFIFSFDNGYDTVIGERGVTLSGGQRQRLALARAFLTSPGILILDDSTSAIDSSTEDRIQKAIFTAARGKSTLVITHRLSQIRWADLILVVRQGEIVAKGKHEILLDSSQVYRQIFRDM
jgi:ATP-binding cassette subfamily B protein